MSKVETFLRQAGFELRTSHLLQSIARKELFLRIINLAEVLSQEEGDKMSMSEAADILAIKIKANTELVNLYLEPKLAKNDWLSLILKIMLLKLRLIISFSMQINVPMRE